MSGWAGFQELLVLGLIGPTWFLALLTTGVTLIYTGNLLRQRWLRNICVAAFLTFLLLILPNSASIIDQVCGSWTTLRDRGTCVANPDWSETIRIVRLTGIWIVILLPLTLPFLALGLITLVKALVECVRVRLKARA